MQHVIRGFLVNCGVSSAQLFICSLTTKSEFFVMVSGLGKCRNTEKEKLVVSTVALAAGGLQLQGLTEWTEGWILSIWPVQSAKHRFLGSGYVSRLDCFFGCSVSVRSWENWFPSLPMHTRALPSCKSSLRPSAQGPSGYPASLGTSTWRQSSRCSCTFSVLEREHTEHRLKSILKHLWQCGRDVGLHVLSKRKRKPWKQTRLIHRLERAGRSELVSWLSVTPVAYNRPLSLTPVSCYCVCNQLPAC